MRWDNEQECQDALQRTWEEFRQRWPERTQDAYHSYRRRQGVRSASVQPQARAYVPPGMPAEAAGSVPPGVSTAPAPSAQVVVPLGGAQTGGQYSVAFGDMHMGDVGVMLNCLRECQQTVVETARMLQPRRIVLMDVGDSVAGRGVFRNQELTLILPLAAPQVLWAAWEIRRWHMALREACPEAEIVWLGVDGNHKALGENVSYMLAMVLRLFDVPWMYCGRHMVENLALSAEDPYLLRAEHGFGGSSYYPNSYAFIRGTWQSLLQADRKHAGSYIRRVVCGHTHWLNIDFSVGDDRRLDTVGGFQRQERYNLPQVTRPVGMVTYYHDGASLTVGKVMPKQATVDRDEENPTLDMENQIAAAKALLQVHEHMSEIGVIAARGVSAR